MEVTSVVPDSGKKRCALCERIASEAEYCSYHEKAFSRLKLAFKKWNEAYANMSWERYLERILELEETGDWARQVAKHQLKATTG
ncbi:MAG: hypothetical protein M1587_06125 [Thaumarchaeota archaeon]|nr:hypothetical protein [Nitrososphaerota archaeon]